MCADGFAFLGHETAIDVIRSLGRDVRRTCLWPDVQRPLPGADRCVSSQREFRAFVGREPLSAYGIMSSPAHLLVPDASCRRKGSLARFHVWKQDVPRHAMLRLSRRLLSSGPELALIQLAGYQLKAMPLFEEASRRACLQREELSYIGIDENPQIDHPLRWEHFMRRVRMASIAMEMAGSYRLSLDGGRPDYRVGPVMSMTSLAGVIGMLPGAFGRGRILDVIDIAADGSASPMETSLFLMLTLPAKWGGFGLPQPLLNCALDVSSLRGVLSRGDVVTPDLLWPSCRVAVEYESDEFHGKWHRPRLQSDVQRANALLSMGYAVLRATPREVLDLQVLTMLAQQIARLIGHPIEAVDMMAFHRRKLLHAELFPSRWMDDLAGRAA